ncbi:MAG: Spy/CpxP family protein refolding chaperone [Acidiferrobacterales bacterium]
MMGRFGGADPLDALNLTDQQRKTINGVFDAERKQHWVVMGKMLDEQEKLRDLFAQDEPDPKKVGAVYGQIAILRQQMIEAHVQAENQMQNVLTKEQREQFHEWRRGDWGPGRGPRSRNFAPAPRGTGSGMMGR